MPVLLLKEQLFFLAQVLLLFLGEGRGFLKNEKGGVMPISLGATDLEQGWQLFFMGGACQHFGKWSRAAPVYGGAWGLGCSLGAEGRSR